MSRTYSGSPDFVAHGSVRQLLYVAADDLDGALHVDQPVGTRARAFVDVDHLDDDLAGHQPDDREDAKRHHHLEQREPRDRSLSLPVHAHQCRPTNAVTASTGPISSPSATANTV